MAKYSSDKQLDQWLRKAVKDGWEIEWTGSGHLRAIPPDGGKPVICPATPGGGRSLLNTRAQLRRAGLDI